jgi:uncharacterized GH25 family protein
MRTRTIVSCSALALALVLPMQAQAHRGWILPSATILSGQDPWVTVDAAVSTDVFYADHNPMRLDGLVITAPDGARVSAENPSTGKFRSSFDLKLAQKGTYKLAVVNDGLNAVYKLNGETKRARGTAESLAKEVPADAQELRVTRSQSRGETFVTSGSPTARVLQPSGVGLELVPITHPNDLLAGRPASFAFLLDGKPAANLQVTIIPGGIRYRDRLEDMRLVTDQQGRVTVRWPAAGLYWMNATYGGNAMDAAGGGSIAQPARRASYSATLEVLPQ